MRLKRTAAVGPLNISTPAKVYLNMNLLSGKIVTVEKGIISANLDLTDSPIMEVTMAQTSLPLGSTDHNHCVVPDCCSPIKNKKRGLCQMHYVRFRKHGDVNVRLQIWRYGEGDTFDDRVWSLAQKMPSGCWEWQGSINPTTGYGRLRVDGKNRDSHRVVWKLIHGEHSLLHILHSCDNRICVNPAHLREGTHQDNADDKVSRGRQLRGEAVYGSKLAAAQVLEIRSIAETPDRPGSKRIGMMFGVAERTIREIIKRDTWKHI